MSAARHLEDLAEELSTRKAAGERTLKVWGHRRGLTLPDVRSLARQLVAQGRLVEGEGPGGLVWRPVERRTLDLPPLEIETGEPSPIPPPASVERAIEEEPVLVAGAAEPCQECDRLRQERDMAQGEAYGLRQQLQEVSAERDEARARCAAWEQEADHAYRQLCRAADLEEGSPLSSILERVRLLVGAAKASAERPVVDHGAVAHYLLDLPEERWTGLGQARKDLAQGRRLTGHGTRLQAEALAAVDRLLSTPAGAQAPAPATVGEAMGPTPRRTQAG